MCLFRFFKPNLYRIEIVETFWVTLYNHDSEIFFRFSNIYNSPEPLQIIIFGISTEFFQNSLKVTSESLQNFFEI